MKNLFLFVGCLILFSCSTKNSNDGTEDSSGQSENSTYYDPESIEGTIPDDIETEVKAVAPQFNEVQSELFELLDDDRWVKQSEDKGEESFFRVNKENGFYRFPELVDDEYYLSEIEIWDKESYFLTFSEGDITTSSCYLLSVLSTNSISIDPFDQCARALGYPTTYTRNGIEDSKAESVEFSIIARWEAVQNFQGDLDYVFMTPDGGEFTFSFIEAKDFNDYDNPYFESTESEESIFPVYVIKEEVKDVYYSITYISDMRPIDLADEEQEVLIITSITEIG